jgi:hypothetical protein
MKALKFRALIYPLTIVPLLALAVFAFTLCLRGGAVPHGIVNSSVAQWLANRVGIQYSIGTLRIGCFQKDCGTFIDSGQVALTLPTVGQLHLGLNNFHWCPIHPITVKGLKLGAPGIPGLTFGNIEFSTITRSAELRDLRLERDTQPPITIRRIAASPAVWANQGDRLTFDRVDIDGLNAEIGGSSAPTSICEQTQAMFTLTDEVASLAQSGRGWVDGLIGRSRRDLLYLSIIWPAVLIILKLLATTWIKRHVRLILCATSVALPLICYSLLKDSFRTRQFLAVVLALTVAQAILAWALFYRKGMRGYQRWEPFTIDLACFTIVLPLIASNFSLPSVQLPKSVEIASVNLADSSFVLNASRCGEKQAIQTRLGHVAVENLVVKLPDSIEQLTVLNIANIRLPGIAVDVPGIQLSALAASVRDVAFELDGKSRQLQDLTAGFDVSGSVRRGSADPIHFSAAAGSVGFIPEFCDFRYGAELQVAAKPVGGAVIVTGDSKVVGLRSLRTLPGSAFDLKDGSGTVSLGDNVLATLQLSGLRTALGGSQIRIATADVSAKAPPLCSTGEQTISMAVSGTEIAGAEGWSGNIARSDIRFARGVSGKTSANVTLRNTALSIPASATNAAIPILNFGLAGTTGGAPLPQSFEGEVRFSAGTGNDVFIAHDKPLRLSADLRSGDLRMPLQSQVLQQTVLAGLPQDIPFAISANGRFSDNLETFVQIPRLALPAGPLRAELNGIELHSKGSAVDFTTGWNRVALPAAPAAFCLEKISQFALSTAGEAAGLAFPDLASGGSAANFPCIDIPSLPSQQEFRVEAMLPPASGRSALRLETKSGSAVDIRKLQSHVRRINFVDGQVRAMELDSESSGVRVPGRAGESNTKTRISISGADAKLSSVVSGLTSDDLELALDNGNGRLHLEAFERNRLNRGTADVWFDGPELVRLNANVSLPGGPLTSSTGLEIATGKSTLKLNLDKDNVVVDADVAGLFLNRQSADGGETSAKADLRAEVYGRLYRNSPQRVNPVVGLVSRAADNLGQVYSTASPAGATTPFRWDLSIQNSQGAEPLLQVRDDQIGLRVATNIRRLSGGALDVNGEAVLDGDLRIHDGQLVMDAYAPIRLNGLPLGALNFRMPILLAFTDTLKPATTPERLWDTDYYTKFWSSYVTGQASRGTAAFIDDSRRVVGSLSIRELVAPLSALQIAIGYSGGIGIHVPLSARVLHGTAAGFLDASATWPNNRLALQSRLGLHLENLQAGAIGLDSNSGHLPFLEHELDGDISLRTEGWPLTIAGASFGLDLRTAGRNGSLPGTFQFGSGTSVKTLNGILDKVIRDLQFAVPPSSFSFRNFALSLNVDRGKVRTDGPWLTIEGLRIVSSENVNLEGNIRLHGARNGETVDLRGLLEDFRLAPAND